MDFFLQPFGLPTAMQAILRWTAGTLSRSSTRACSPVRETGSCADGYESQTTAVVVTESQELTPPFPSNPAPATALDWVNMHLEQEPPDVFNSRYSLLP